MSAPKDAWVHVHPGKPHTTDGVAGCPGCADMRRKAMVSGGARTLVVGSLAKGEIPSDVGLASPEKIMVSKDHKTRRTVARLRNDRGGMYSFYVSNGRLQEFVSPAFGYRVVAREADQALIASITAIDLEITATEARLAELRAERALTLETAVPRLPLVRVDKE